MKRKFSNLFYCPQRREKKLPESRKDRNMSRTQSWVIQISADYTGESRGHL